jgi:hypothetical protein
VKRREVRKLDALEKDERRLEAAIGEKERVAELRERVAVACHVPFRSVVAFATVVMGDEAVAGMTLSGA